MNRGGGRPMTKDELKRYKYISDEIAQLWDEINRLRDGLMSPSGKVITWTPASPRQDDKFAEVMAQIDEFEHKLIEKLEERIKLQRSIEHVIDSVDDSLYRVILRSRYIQGKTWKEICDQTNYSRSQINCLHGKALKKIKDRTLSDICS